MSGLAGWLWLILALGLVVAEMATGTVLLLLVAGAAALSAVCAFCGLGGSVQAAVFLVGVVQTCILAPVLVRRLQRRGSSERFGVDALLGQAGIVTEAIDPLSGRGMVQVGAERWRARAGETIEAGAGIEVTAVEGAKLVVRPSRARERQPRLAGETDAIGAEEGIAGRE